MYNRFIIEDTKKSNLEGMIVMANKMPSLGYSTTSMDTNDEEITKTIGFTFSGDDEETVWLIYSNGTLVLETNIFIEESYNLYKELINC